MNWQVDWKASQRVPLTPLSLCPLTPLALFRLPVWKALVIPFVLKRLYFPRPKVHEHAVDMLPDALRDRYAIT